MPTTCGFPNCKFRSRYRGQEDNRHFYRIPKRPPILRQAWLCAIGRSEETVVSQLRICSAHFYGGEKREGDIPVADPQIDPPEFIELPPKESRSSERRARLKGHSSSSALLSAPSALFSSMSGERPQLPSLIRTGSAARRGERRNMRLLHFGGANRFSSMGFAAMAGKGTQQQQSNHGGGIFAVGGGVTTTTTPCSPAQPEQKQQERASVEGVEGGGAADKPNSSASSSSFIFPQHQQSSSQFATSSAFLSSLFGMNKLPANTVLQSNHALSRITPPVATQFAGTKPLVALLDGRDCSIEMPLLKDIATVAFCDAQTTGEIHEKVLNEATAALLYHSISLGRDDLVKFKALKVVVRIGSGVHNVDVQAASEQGIAVCHMAAECVEETADSTMSLILSMFRRTFWLSRTIHSGKQPNGIEQLRELMAGSTRIRGSTLGLIGLGRVGMAVAQRAKSFGFNVAVYDPHISLGIERSIGVERYENLAEMLNRCDCVSLHCPLQPDTRHIINADTIKAFKFGAFLVNTGQPELCQSNALLSALKTGHIRAAAFDYVGAQVNRGGEREILEVLSSLPNVICTPHCAWYSDESSRELREAAAREVRRALTGTVPEDLRNCVNRTELMALKRFVGQMAPQQFPASPPVAPLFPNLIAQQQQRHSAQQRNAAGTAMQLQQREFGGATLGTTPGQFSMPGLVSLCAQSNLTENPSNPMPSFLNTDNALSAYQQHLLMLQPHLIQHIAQQNAAAKFGAALSRETGSGTIAALPPDTNNDMNCVQQQHLVVDEPMESSGGTELGGNGCATAASDGMLDLRDEQDASKLESENGRAHSVDELSVRNNNATPPSFTQPQSHKYITSFQSNSSPNSARICGENEVKKSENGQLKED